MTKPLTIPDEKRAQGGRVLGVKVHRCLALTFLAGMWTAYGIYWLTKSPPNLVGIAYLISALASLLIAILWVNKLFRHT